MCVINHAKDPKLTVEQFREVTSKINTSMVGFRPPNNITVVRVADMTPREYDLCEEYNLGDMGKMRFFLRTLFGHNPDDSNFNLKDIHNPISEHSIITNENSWVVMMFDPKDRDKFIGWGLLVPHYTQFMSDTPYPTTNLKLCCFNGEAHIYIRKQYRKKGYGSELWTYLDDLNKQFYGEAPHCNAWNASSQRFFKNQGIDTYLWL